MKYANDIRSVTDDIPTKIALRELVVAIRENIEDRSSAADTRRIMAMAGVTAAVERYALARLDSNVKHDRCTHPNAYAIGGRAMMYCPTCGPFSAMEE